MLRGDINLVTRTRISGWSWDTEKPDTPISLIVTANGEVVARALANRYRKDLEAAGIGNGRFSYDLQLFPPLSLLSRQVVEVRRETDGVHVPGSPRILEPSNAFDQATKSVFAQILSATESKADVEERLAFLLEQVGKLRQAYVDDYSSMPERESRRRWAWQDPSVAVGAAQRPAAVTPRPHALVIDERGPSLRHDAGSNAILSHMRSLKRLGYDVTFAPITLRGDRALLEAEEISACLHPWYATIEEVLQRHRARTDLVYLHRVAAAARYSALVRHHQPKARIVFSVADLAHVRLNRQADVEERPELKQLGERMRRMEMTAGWLADAVITHSSAEAAILGRNMKPEKVHVVPWAVPLRPTTKPFAERRGIAFIGFYGHAPNVDAARWLVEAIMPLVAEADPTLPCLLVGSEMPYSLRKLAKGNIEAIENVADLAQVFDRVRLTVAPLTYGAGLKGKVLDSFAAGIPCVCSPVGAEGLDLPPVLRDQIAEAPADLARKIRTLHDDEALNKACSDAALDFMKSFASEERLDALLGRAVGVRR